MVGIENLEEGVTHVIVEDRSALLVLLNPLLERDPEMSGLSGLADKARRDGIRHVVIDMHGVDYLYSRHVSQLIALKSRPDADVTLCSVEKMVAETLGLLNMEEVFARYDTREEALASLDTAWP